MQIDLTRSARDVLTSDFGPLRYIAQNEQDGYLARSVRGSNSTEKLVLTFDGLLARTPFSASMRAALKLLETHYGSPVDTEFTVEIINPNGQPEVRITLLQCRRRVTFRKRVKRKSPPTFNPKTLSFHRKRWSRRARWNSCRSALRPI